METLHHSALGGKVYPVRLVVAKLDRKAAGRQDIEHCPRPGVEDPQPPEFVRRVDPLPAGGDEVHDFRRRPGQLSGFCPDGEQPAQFRSYVEPVLDQHGRVNDRIADGQGPAGLAIAPDTAKTSPSLEPAKIVPESPSTLRLGGI